MSRTEIEKKSEQSELAKAVAFARREGENEVETATRLLGELARLRKPDGRRKQKRKGQPPTDVAASFGELHELWVDEEDELIKVAEKGDPKSSLRGRLLVECRTNGTVTLANVSADRRGNTIIGTGVSKRSPHDDRNDLTGRKQAVIRAIRDLVKKTKAARRRRRNTS